MRQTFSTFIYHVFNKPETFLHQKDFCVKNTIQGVTEKLGKRGGRT